MTVGRPGEYGIRVPDRIARRSWRRLLSPWTIVVALSLLAASLSTLRLGDRSIWQDEATSISYASGTWRALLHEVVDKDPNQALYYALLWFWQHLFGSDVVTMRGPSIVFAALTVPVAFVLGRRLFGVAAGIIAAALLAISPFLLTYAQEARGYTLVAFLVTASSYFFVAQLATRQNALAAGYVATSSLAFYAHFHAAFVIVAQVLYLAIMQRRSALHRYWAVQYGAIVVLALPIVYASATLPYSPIGWLTEPGWSDLFDAVREVAGGTTGILLAYGAICVTALVLAVRRADLRAGFVFTAIWLFTPILLSFALSEVKPMFLSRYLIVAFPAAALLAGGVLAHAARPLGLLMGIAVLGLSVPALEEWHSRPPRQDWKGLTSYVLSNTRPGDAIFLWPVALPYEYYAARSDLRAPHRLTLANRGELGQYSRIWLVLFRPPPDEERLIRAELRRHEYTRQRLPFSRNITVELMARSGDG
jgi:mannosyltransferase